MDDDREAFEFAYALYLARKVDREAAQMIVEATEALNYLSGQPIKWDDSRPR